MLHVPAMYDMLPTMRLIDLSGEKFGRLTVLERAENNKLNKVQWLCRCECGKEKIIARNELRSGDTKSCGCLDIEKFKERRYDKGRPPHNHTHEEWAIHFLIGFWEKVKITDGCWEWKSSKDKNGYGIYQYKNLIRRAHRFSYLIHKGELEKGKLVCHKCDNPSCVNPEHLYQGTNSDNMLDRFQNRWSMSKRKV